VMGRLGLGYGRRGCEKVGLGMPLEMGRSIGMGRSIEMRRPRMSI
jgi:hypothetical protein